MLSVEVLTLFPRMIAAPLEESILGKARSSGLLRVQVTDIREYAEGKHRVTDDVPYGGGAGMVMKPEPLVAAIEAAKARARRRRDLHRRLHPHRRRAGGAGGGGRGGTAGAGRAG